VAAFLSVKKSEYSSFRDTRARIAVLISFSLALSSRIYHLGTILMTQADLAIHPSMDMKLNTVGHCCCSLLFDFKPLNYCQHTVWRGVGNTTEESSSSP